MAHKKRRMESVEKKKKMMKSKEQESGKSDGSVTRFGLELNYSSSIPLSMDDLKSE